MNQKTLVSVLAVLVLIFGGTTIYFLTAQKSVAPVVQAPAPVSKNVPVTEKTSPVVQSSPTTSVVQNETAMWKTYTDSNYGYSFQYPQELIVNEKSTSSITIGSPAAPYLNVSVQKLVGGLTVFAQNQILTGSGGMYKKEDIACVQKTILNRASAECSYENQIGGYTGKMVTTFISGENGNVLRVSALSDYAGMTQPEFQNKVVASFRFIEAK